VIGELTADDQAWLLDAAQEAVRARLEDRPLDLAPVPAALAVPGATFVTLRMPADDRLLGCVGSMVPVRPLVEDVAHNAAGSAFSDPRLPSLTPAEFAAMEIKISILGPLTPVDVDSYGALVAAVQPGIDGLLVEAASHRATFLPSVWEQVDDVEQFLTLLWRKAGLRPRTWPRKVHVHRYRTLEFGAKGPRAPIRSVG
jgi:AmmeMemoRadiSam system protein A